MRAKNYKQIRNRSLVLSAYLAGCIALCALFSCFYCQVGREEVGRIVSKTEEYDHVYMNQLELVEQFDSLYRYMMMFNTNKNDAALQNVVSKQKQVLVKEMENMNGADTRLYRTLVAQVNSFLSVKDSIRILKLQEDLLRNDLRKCMEENKSVGRQLVVGSTSQEN